MNKSLCYNFWTFTIYFTITCNHKSIIHKSIDKEAYMWIGGFCLHGRTKKTNARVLKDVMSFLSNSTGPSNSTRQWGLKPPEEELVKDEVISYNEG
jgi:hypothetical protein